MKKNEVFLDMQNKVYMDVQTMFYDNVDPRRKQELSDSRMVYEDQNAMANCHDKPIYHTFNPDRYVEHLNMFNQSTKTKR